MSDLHEAHCQACEGIGAALEEGQIRTLMSQVHERWRLRADGKALEAEFSFKNYYQTMAFLNAVAFMANRENHHPDIRFGYNSVQMEWQTHAVGGVTHNDLICAAKVDRLLS
ncbi:MAG: 4a-hydroxytetrahydrobiopterin dehydratase [Oceanococcaceae bacterium]